MFPCSQELQNWFETLVRDHICFYRAAAFISVSVGSHKLVDLAVVGVLVTYFSDSKYSKASTLKKAAIFTSVQDGISATLAIVAPWISYNASHPLGILKCSSFSCIVALGLLYHTASCKISESKFELLNVIGMILLAVGEGGMAHLLGPFLAIQLRAHGPDERRTKDPNDKQVKAGKRVWRLFAWCCSVAAAYNLETWPKTFGFTLMVMGSSLIFLLLGVPSYHRTQLPPVHGFAIIRVVKAALKKKDLSYPSSADQFFWDDENKELHLSPGIQLLRWIDKAAIIESSSRREEQKEAGTLCTVAQVRESKSLLKLLPMWASFIVFGLVLSAGNTLFPEQGANMLSKKFLICLLAFKPVCCATTSYVSKKIISKCDRETKRRQAQVVIIFIGMVMSTVCCVVAWQVEVRRLEKKRMSMFWLVPQFCLLGHMKGLAWYGLRKYSKLHFPRDKDMKGRVSAMNKFFLGIGSVLNIFFILVNKSQFRRTLDNSGLDKYYKRLAVVSVVNMCYGLLLSILYIQSDQKPNAETRHHEQERPLLSN